MRKEKKNCLRKLQLNGVMNKQNRCDRVEMVKHLMVCNDGTTMIFTGLSIVQMNIFFI